MLVQDPETPVPARPDGMIKFAGIPILLWVPLLTVVPSTITAVAGLSSGYHQGRESVVIPPVVVPSGPINESGQAEMNKVKGRFVEPISSPVKRSFRCSGTVVNFRPESQHLWIAVETEGYLFFKESNFQFTNDGTSWNTSIDEYGGAKTVSLLLFTVNDEANIKIKEWIAKGIANKNRFDPVTSFVGTTKLDHRDFLQLEDLPPKS